MKNLYRFTEFLSEDDNMGDFAKKFTERMSSLGDNLEKEKEKSDKLQKPTGFDQAKGNAFRKWMKEKHSDFKDSKDQTLDYKADKNYAFDNSTIREAYAKYGDDYKKESSGLDQKTGNEFRKWMSEKYPDYKYGKQKLDYKEGENHPFDNDTIKDAYSKYGKEWEESKKK